MRHSGKIKYTALGLALGMVVTGGTFVYADDVFQTVSAYLTNDVKIEYNGDAQTLPSGYNILNYDSRSYVPLRYVSELLGADVEWDNDTRSISINMEQPSDSGNSGTDTSSSSSTVTDKLDNTASLTLPQGVETFDYSVEATMLGKEVDKDYPEGRKLYLRILNKTDNIMRVDVNKAYFTVNGTIINYNEIDSDKDTKLSANITRHGTENDEREGYIRLPIDIERGDYVEATIFIYFDDDYERIPITFKMDMNKLISANESRD